MNKHITYPVSPAEIGRWGEEYAIEELEKKGYVLLDHNYRSRYGEIDCIFYHHGFIVFVEVKTRRGDHCGSGVDAINSYKLLRMSRTATVWLMKSRKKHAELMYHSRVRFDIFCIDITSSQVVTSHYEDISLWE